MLYRDQFIYGVANVSQERKQQVIDHMRRMRTNAFLFRLVEIFETFFIDNVPLSTKQMAAGFSSLLHQYYIFGWEQDDLATESLKLAREYYPPDHKVWDIYKNDCEYWSVKYVGKYYENIDLESFEDFERIGLRHRSYTFILYETVKPYIRPHIQNKVYESLVYLMHGISYFYDVVMYMNWRDENLSLEYSRFSERRAMNIMQKNGYNMNNMTYQNLQKYVLATGEYEKFFAQAKTYYQKSYDGFASISPTGGRLRVIKAVINYSDILLKEAQNMFSKT